MDPFKNHRGILVALDRSNVDTDQIIAKQFLKSIARTGFGKHLFYDWRFREDGSPIADFPLNQPRFKKASVLVARNNFGCGSSREHAVWAIHQYGFKAVIAPWREDPSGGIPAFADIFRNNASKNALLTIELSEAEVEEIFKNVTRFAGLEATIDLDEQRVTLHLPEEVSFHFEIDAAVKDRMIHGLDDIGITLKEEKAIHTFETAHDAQIS